MPKGRPPAPRRRTGNLPEVTDYTEPRHGERVAIATLTSGEPAMAYVDSLLWMVEAYRNDPKLTYRLDPRGWRIVCRSGANVSRARNSTVIEFLQMEHAPEWLLLVDDDMAWPADALERLLASADPNKIIGGLCFAYGPESRLTPTIYQETDTQPFTPMPVDYEIPNNTLVQVAGTGGAFLLVHREALMRMWHASPTATPNAWFREVEVMLPNPNHDPDNPDSQAEYPHWISEDLWFCQLAYAAGLEVFVHTGVEIEHVKRHRLTRDLYDQARTLVKMA